MQQFLRRHLLPVVKRAVRPYVGVPGVRPEKIVFHVFILKHMLHFLALDAVVEQDPQLRLPAFHRLDNLLQPALQQLDFDVLPLVEVVYPADQPGNRHHGVGGDG